MMKCSQKHLERGLHPYTEAILNEMELDKLPTTRELYAQWDYAPPPTCETVSTQISTADLLKLRTKVMTFAAAHITNRDDRGVLLEKQGLKNGTLSLHRDKSYGFCMEDNGSYSQKLSISISAPELYNIQYPETNYACPNDLCAFSLCRDTETSWIISHRYVHPAARSQSFGSMMLTLVKDSIQAVADTTGKTQSLKYADTLGTASFHAGQVGVLLQALRNRFRCTNGAQAEKLKRILKPDTKDLALTQDILWHTSGRVEGIILSRAEIFEEYNHSSAEKRAEMNIHEGLQSVADLDNAQYLNNLAWNLIYDDPDAFTKLTYGIELVYDIKPQ